MAEAVALLARRDFSRQELRERLLRRTSEARARSGGQADGPGAQHPEAEAEAQAAVDAVLARLQALGYLDDERLARARAQARATQLGLRRIEHELQRLQAPLDADTRIGLRETEAARAQALWQRRFGEPATDPRGHARQARFLLARGFDGDLVRRIVGPVPRVPRPREP
jgi:regulatory protein